MSKLLRVIFLVLSLVYLGACTSVQDEKAQNDAKNKLRQNGITFSPSEFVVEAGKGNLPAVKLFVEGGMDINTTPSETALFAASYYNRMSVVKYLVEQGANINKAAYLGSPLMGAIKAGNYDIVNYLLEQGADPNQLGDEKKSPLYVAAFEEEPEVCAALLKYGANVHYIHPWTGDTPLTGAARSRAIDNSAQTAAVLVKGGADPNYKTPTGMSVLDWAIMHRKFNMAMELVKLGASINDGHPGDYASRTMLAALAWGAPEIIKEFVKMGISPNAKAFGKEPLLVWCAKNYLERAAEVLIDLGADVKATGSNGMTVMDYAIANREEGLIKKLDPNYNLNNLEGQIVDPNIQPQKTQIQNIMGGEYYQANTSPEVQQAVQQAVKTNMAVGAAANQAVTGNNQAAVPATPQATQTDKAIVGTLEKAGQQAKQAQQNFDYPVDQENLEKEIDAEIKKIEEKYSTSGNNSGLSSQEDDWYKIPDSANLSSSEANADNTNTSPSAGLPPGTGLDNQTYSATVGKPADSTKAVPDSVALPSAYNDESNKSIDDMRDAMSNPVPMNQRTNHTYPKDYGYSQNPTVNPEHSDNSPIASAIKNYKSNDGQNPELNQIQQEVQKRKQVPSSLSDSNYPMQSNNQYYDPTQK